MSPFRRKYFIKKDFQTRFILRFVFTATFWAITAVSLIALMAESRLEEVLYSSHINITSTASLLIPSVLQAHTFSLLFFSFVLAYAIQNLWKRLAVPLYSLKKDLSRMAGGDLVNAIGLRDDEEFQDMAEDIDGMRIELRKKFMRIKEGQANLAAVLSTLEKAALKEGVAKQHSSSLRAAVSGIKEALNDFNN